MLTFKEKFDQLTYAYSVPCPVCGAQCTFEMKSLEVWTQSHVCHAEYEKLIEKRLDDYLDQLKAGER
jgi:hypothetical protein